MALVWAPMKLLPELMPTIETVFADLTDDDYSRLVGSLTAVSEATSRRRDRSMISSFDCPQLSGRVAALWLLINNISLASSKLAGHHLEMPQIHDLVVTGQRAQRVQDAASLDLSVPSTRRALRDALSIASPNDYAALDEPARRVLGVRMPIELANDVLRESERFPDWICELSLQVLRRRLRPIPVGRTADREKWMFN